MLPVTTSSRWDGHSLETMIEVANCVLSDQMYGPDDEVIRWPLNKIFNVAANTILRAKEENREGWLVSLDPTGPLVKLRLPAVIGISGGLPSFSTRALQGYLQDEYSYADGSMVYRVEDFERQRPIIEEIWGCPVIIERMPDNPLGVTIRPAPPSVRLPEKIWLVPAADNGVVLGTDVFTGQVIVEHVSNLPHMLIVGTSGFGKSVFLNQIITQLVAASPSEVARLLLVDLKGGIEFHSYARKSNRVRVVWEFENVVAEVENLVELMMVRQREMVANSWRLYPGQRVFFIVDEFAQIQLYPAETKDEKATHARLIANLNRLSMLGRAVGIVLIAAIQKPTTDCHGQLLPHEPARAGMLSGAQSPVGLDDVR